MRHKGRASFLAASHAAPVQEQKQEQGKFRNRENSGTGVVCASTVDEPFATSFSLVGPRPCPRRPTAFRFLLTTTNPDWQKGTAPQPPRPFPGFPRTAPRLAATALVCASPESTQTHATSRMGRRREREEEKKRTDSAPRPRVDRWTSSHPHLTGVDHTEDVPHLHEPPVDLVRPNHRHRGRLGMQGTDPPPPSRRACVHPASPLSKSARLRDLPDRDWDWALDQPFAQSPWSPFRDELVAKTAAAGLPLSLIARPRPSVSLPSGQPAPRPALRVPDAATAGHRW